MKEPKSKYGKRFNAEFQRDAVRMLESGERTAKQLSQELGVKFVRVDINDRCDAANGSE